MERITHRLTLDVHKGGVQQTLQGLHTTDTMSRVVAINLVAGSDTVELTPDTQALMYVEDRVYECDVRGNTIVYEVRPLRVPGITTMQLKIITGTINGVRSVLASPCFAVEVSASDISDEGLENSEEFGVLEKALVKAQSVYDTRLVGISIDEDCIFRATYADGTVYESDVLVNIVNNGNHLMAQSYAVGGTGIRRGEDTDNSKYYAKLATDAAYLTVDLANDVGTMRDELLEQSVFTRFEVNFETGNLEYVSHDFEFDVDDDGYLVANKGSTITDSMLGSVVDAFINRKSAEIDERLTNLEEAKTYVLTATDDGNGRVTLSYEEVTEND